MHKHFLIISLRGTNSQSRARAETRMKQARIYEQHSTQFVTTMVTRWQIRPI